MSKIWRRVSAALLAGLTALALTACSDDDSDEKGSDEPTQTQTQSPSKKTTKKKTTKKSGTKSKTTKTSTSKATKTKTQSSAGKPAKARVTEGFTQVLMDEVGAELVDLMGEDVFVSYVGCIVDEIYDSSSAETLKAIVEGDLEYEMTASENAAFDAAIDLCAEQLEF